MKEFPTHIVAVDGIVENAAGEVLLVQNMDSGNWTLPGGQIEIGETLPQGLLREIYEESGIVATVDTLVCVHSNTQGRPGWGEYAWVPTKVMFSFACTYVSGTPRGSNETHQAVWVPKEKVPQHITAPVLATRWQAYLQWATTGAVQYLAYTTHPAFVLSESREM